MPDSEPHPLLSKEKLTSSASAAHSPADTHLGQPVKLHGTLHSHVPAQVGEFDLDEFPRVQGTVPVPAETHSLWETCSWTAAGCKSTRFS